MTEKPLADQVMEWIENNGYPLEMKVAQEFRRSDAFYVEQSRYYRDGNTGKYREADVVATWAGIGHGGISTQVRVVIERKALDKSKGNRKAWILFTENQIDEELGSDFSLSLVPKSKARSEGFHGLIESLVHENPPPLFEPVGRTCYGITQMRLGQNEKDWPYDASRQVIAAALGILDTDEPSEGEKESYQCAIPAIITDNPIFACWLDASGNTHLAETHHEKLLLPAEDGSGYALVHVVHFSKLAEFVAMCSVAAKSFFVTSHASAPQ